MINLEQLSIVHQTFIELTTTVLDDNSSITLFNYPVPLQTNDYDNNLRYSMVGLTVIIVILMFFLKYLE